MSLATESFLFSSPNLKRPNTDRKLHIRRLYDLLQLCIQRHDFERANRAWSILARCKEVDWKSLWTTGLFLLSRECAMSSQNRGDAEYLRTMMLQHPDDKEQILTELVLCLLLARKPREALDELELYLPSFPYQDNPVFHIYAGLSALDLAFDGTEQVANPAILRDAQTHFEHAKSLDPDNIVTQAFLDKIATLQTERPMLEEESEDESPSPHGEHDRPSRTRKRVRR